MILAVFLAVFLDVFLACSADPDPCVAMCDAAAELYGSCLDSWELGWDSAGYQDQADFVHRCETWAWEARLLEDDAGEAGTIDALCQQRAETFDLAMADPEAPECAAYTDIEWDVMPWEG